MERSPSPNCKHRLGEFSTSLTVSLSWFRENEIFKWSAMTLRTAFTNIRFSSESSCCCFASEIYLRICDDPCVSDSWFLLFRQSLLRVVIGLEFLALCKICVCHLQKNVSGWIDSCKIMVLYSEFVLARYTSSEQNARQFFLQTKMAEDKSRQQYICTNCGEMGTTVWRWGG